MYGGVEISRGQGAPVVVVTAEGVQRAIDEISSEVAVAREKLQAFILEQAEPIRASKAFTLVIARTGFAPSVVREAMWQLVEEQELILTEDRKLTVKDDAA